jgi:hypothetical protein
VFGHKKFPENFCEFITPPIETKLFTVWIENAGRVGVSDVELKCAVNPLDVWSIGVGMYTVSVGDPLSKLKVTVLGEGVGAGFWVGATVGVG